MSGNITIGGEDLGTSDPWEAITSLRQERDSLTGRVAELVTEGNELRAIVGEMYDHIASGDDYARPDTMAKWRKRAGLED